MRSNSLDNQLLLLSRAIAILLGMSAMIGEAIRSWGQGRPLLYVVDDFLVGIPLVAMAILTATPTPVRKAGLVACFAATSAMAYGSFVTKIVDPTSPMSSNVNNQMLTAVVGIGFALSMVGLITSLLSVGRQPDTE